MKKFQSNKIIKFIIVKKLTMRQWINFGIWSANVNFANTCQGINTIDIHSARSADTFTTRTTESQSSI